MAWTIDILIVGFGGFLGTVSRYLLSKYASTLLGDFPLGTLVVNVVGCFLIGLIMYGVMLGRSVSPELRTFAVVGVIGGFTTMSSFAYESVRLLELKEYALAGTNMGLNVVLSLLAVGAGRALAVLLTR